MSAQLPGPQLSGKVAVITGGARGQGRSHAERLAAEGADIVVVDVCHDIDAVPYPMGTQDELDETAALVEKHGRRCIARQADVRDFLQLESVVAEALSELGRIDIVVANAGVAPVCMDSNNDALAAAWDAAIGVNLTGVWNTVRACAPSMMQRDAGGSIVLISSTAGLKGMGAPGIIGNEGYTASKHGVVGLMRCFAMSLAKHSIRVNTIHPTGVDTQMVKNPMMDAFMELYPNLEMAFANLLPVELLQPNDVSDTVVFLASDASKYITGVTLSVDAGFNVR